MTFWILCHRVPCFYVLKKSVACYNIFSTPDFLLVTIYNNDMYHYFADCWNICFSVASILLISSRMFVWCLSEIAWKSLCLLPILFACPVSTWCGYWRFWWRGILWVWSGVFFVTGADEALLLPGNRVYQRRSHLHQHSSSVRHPSDHALPEILLLGGQSTGPKWHHS